MGSKKALLFEKRSKNFCSLGARVEETPTPYEQEFFGSFCKQELVAFCGLPHRPGGSGKGHSHRNSGIEREDGADLARESLANGDIWTLQGQT
jgi:hypothetical protein